MADLVNVLAEIRGISGRVLPVPQKPFGVERTLQALMGAISAVEHATEVLTCHGQRTPF